MERKKLIALRIDSKTLSLIDSYCLNNKQFYRSSFINTFLRNALSVCDDTTLYHILYTFDPYGDGYTLQFNRPNKNL